MTRYVIIGFGCAGYYAAKTIRENDPEGMISVYSEHGYAPYNPMLTTYYTAGRIPFEGLFPFGDLQKITSELDLDMHAHESVAHISAKDQEIILADGRHEHFDKLLIASGARAFAPKFEGLDPAEAFYMRTVDDAVKLREALEQHTYRNALVVGASMVGIKVVELLNNRGIHTVLADMAPRIFPLAAYPNVSKEIEERITSKGIELALGSAMQKAEKKEDGWLCTMSDGKVLDCDLIVLCIGTRANTQFVDPEEIKMNRAIVVDENMCTSDPHIYAAGDCCEGTELQSRNTMIIGLWANAAHQGTTAGANMSGKPASFNGNFLHNITHFMDMDFIGFGDNRITGEVLTSGNIHDGLYVEAVMKDGHLAGVNILDNYRISGAIKNYLYRIMENNTNDISPMQRGILIKEGLRPSFIEKLEGKLNG